MEKIHRDKNLTIDVHADETAQFHGEHPDLEEMVGNLVDNACKWATSRVAIEVVRERPDAASERQVVRVIVDDDGRGLSPSEREQVAKRGRRLDETKPGSGLGLSIVLELAGLYGGGLTLGTAPLGGLRAELVLPAVYAPADGFCRPPEFCPNPSLPIARPCRWRVQGSFGGSKCRHSKLLLWPLRVPFSRDVPAARTVWARVPRRTQVLCLAP